MRLSAPDRRKKLLTAALELFSRQGYRGTTTREIARRAGVSEALLFRHFPNKEDLYWSVLEEQCAVSTGRQNLDTLFRAGQDDTATFAAIAGDLLTRNFSDSRLYRLLLFCALEDHELSHRFFRRYIWDYYTGVAEHIRRRIAEGAFRDVDPMLAARAFIGMVLHYFLVEELFRGRRPGASEIKRLSQALSVSWLAGMLPPSATTDNKLPVQPSTWQTERDPLKEMTAR